MFRCALPCRHCLLGRAAPDVDVAIAGLACCRPKAVGSANKRNTYFHPRDRHDALHIGPVASAMQFRNRSLFRLRNVRMRQARLDDPV